MRTILVALLFWFGCGQEPWEAQIPLAVGPGAQAGYIPGWLLGDWMLCRDRFCSELDDSGLRFEAEGHILILEARGSRLELGEGYCGDERQVFWVVEQRDRWSIVVDGREKIEGWLEEQRLVLLIRGEQWIYTPPPVSAYRGPC